MDQADLYLDEIAWENYLTQQECKKCGADSCRKLVEEIISDKKDLSSLHYLSNAKRHALTTVLNGLRLLPKIPKLTFPRAVEVNLIELNNPGNGDPVIVTGNNQYTQEILLIALATVAHPLFVLFSDTRGDTLDMAIILKSFTAETVQKSLQRVGFKTRISRSPLIIPGKAAALHSDIRSRLNMTVEIGPICAMELPLFLENRAHFPIGANHCQ